MKKIFFIIGLGNPGFEYDGTRHNLGFCIVDVIANMNNAIFYAGVGDFSEAVFVESEKVIHLVKPLTYMNNSGIAIKQIIENYNVSLNDILVVTDDFGIPLGSIRIRLKGNDGGHNGLASIIYELGTNEFPRLRCGIKNDSITISSKDLTRFVLSPFEPEEKPIVNSMIQKAAEASTIAAKKGLNFAMNKYNIKIKYPITESYSKDRRQLIISKGI